MSRSKSALRAPWAAVRTITPPSPLWMFWSSLRWRSRSDSESRRLAPTPAPCGM